MGKEFKTYNCQMRYLRDEKNIICGKASGDKEDKISLVRYGYFNLVNGYKKPFVNQDNGDGTYSYIGNTKLSHFVAVKNFDTDLRMLLLKYIVQVEEEIRTLVAYKFDEINNKGKTTWYDVDSYDSAIDVQQRMKVISRCFNEIDKCEQRYMQHYVNKHKEVPTWVFIKGLNLSTFIEFFKILKPEVKDAVCDLYLIKSTKSSNDQLLISMLHWMRKIRNSCAHNERIYGMIRKDGRVNDPFATYLSDRKVYIKHRSQRIMDVIVYLRYFLPDTEYYTFVDEVINLFAVLKIKINPNAFDRVRGELGLRNINDLIALKQTKKEILYNLF